MSADPVCLSFVNGAISRVQSRAATSARRARILHIGKFYPPHRGGIESHLEQLCTGLSQYVDVELLVANDGFRTSETRSGRLNLTRAGTLLKVAGAPLCPSMVRRIRESRADLLHLHLPNPAAVLAYILSGRRMPLVATYHSDIVRQKWMGRAIKGFLDYVMDQCSSLIATSPDYIDSSPVLERYRKRCRIIPLGIATESFVRPDAEQVAAIHARFGAPLVLAVGRLVYYKGFEHLITAMRSVPGHLLLVGDGPRRESLLRVAAECGVADRVTILGGVQDVSPYYHAADVFVLPSVARSEAFGIVQLEAMACGKPVINTSISTGVPYVSVNGATGLTVTPGDSGELARAITLLLENATLRSAYGEAGRQRVEREFTTNLMVDRTLEVYRDLLGAAIPVRSKRVAAVSVH